MGLITLIDLSTLLKVERMPEVIDLPTEVMPELIVLPTEETPELMDLLAELKVEVIDRPTLLTVLVIVLAIDPTAPLIAPIISNILNPH